MRHANCRLTNSHSDNKIYSSSINLPLYFSGYLKNNTLSDKAPNHQISTMGKKMYSFVFVIVKLSQRLVLFIYDFYDFSSGFGVICIFHSRLYLVIFSFILEIQQKYHSTRNLNKLVFERKRGRNNGLVYQQRKGL